MKRTSMLAIHMSPLRYPWKRIRWTLPILSTRSDEEGYLTRVERMASVFCSHQEDDPAVGSSGCREEARRACGRSRMVGHAHQAHCYGLRCCTIEARGQSHHGDNTISISEGGNFLFYLRRLLACCPRLEVLLDAAPYAIDDRPKSYLCSIHPSLASSAPCLRSLEYTQGGPNLGDLLVNLHISRHLRSLKCNNVHTYLTRDLSTSIPAAHQILSLSGLVSLDLFLSSSMYEYWDIITESWSLPSLTHFTFRVPPSSSNVLAPAARRSMHDDAHPAILELCPNITELAISARWIAPHPHPPRTPSPSSIRDPAYGPTSYFRSWRHPNLARIGLRDTHPSAAGFSTTLGNTPCGSHSLAPSSLRADSHGHDSHPTAGMSRRLHSSTNGTHDTTIPSATASHRRAFPALASIYLLDSSPENGLGKGSSSSRHTGTCNPGAGTPDLMFWNAWARHCAARGVALCDWGGQPLSLGPIEIP
ncbi:hypothetical protein BS47DRAFT_1337821 [Hydnum rufescens UP504]|uniref:Uncharacterized protein n=1 Tax=Hydnum rufescens UP504 TaxID=1448309 RepID=A0A9P6E1Q5_9AGAM|nr:hypothetical protein BS47DRAFT_1337821 [Hydnum rufescens UP504]